MRNISVRYQTVFSLFLLLITTHVQADTMSEKNISKRYLYAANYPTSIMYRCEINTKLELTNCALVSNDEFLNTTGIAFNKTYTFVYTTTPSLMTKNAIKFCKVDALHGSFSMCKQTGGDHLWSPKDITLSPTQPIAYVVDSAYIMYCDIQTDGALTHCQKAIGREYNYFPYAIRLTPSGNGAYILADDYDANNRNSINNITFCNIKADGGLTQCHVVYHSDNLYSNIYLNKSGTKIYLIKSIDGRWTNSLEYCNITPDGSITACKKTIQDNLNPNKMALAEDVVYVIPRPVHQPSNTLLRCNFNKEEDLVNCQSIKDLPFYPIGLAISSFSSTDETHAR